MSRIHEPTSLITPCPAPTFITKSADDPGNFGAVCGD
jgi:hypothetical protein